MSHIQYNIRQIASRIVALRAKAVDLELFMDDRELLECRQCGLLEDISFTGQLITCHAPYFGQDTGLRFEAYLQDRFQCPECGSIVQSSQPENKKGGE